MACREHVLDMGPCGYKDVATPGNSTTSIGHNGNDGSTANQRAWRWVTASGTGENLAFGQYTDSSGLEIIVQLIVDDGVANRGH